MTTAERYPTQPPEGRDVLQILDDMVPEQAERLAYDEINDADDEMLQLEVGIMWNIDPELLRPDESVRIGVCHEDGRYRLGDLLKRTYDIDALPMAFIELKVDKEGASFSSSAYVLESGDIVAQVDTSIEEEDVLSEDSEDCFEFAEQLGFGRQWTKALYGADSAGTNVTSELMTLDEAQTSKLYHFLNTLADRV